VGAVLRSARAGDGESLARLWLEMAAYYTALDANAFQIPQSEGLAQSFERDVDALDEAALSVVAEIDDRVVGWIYAQLLEPQDDASHQMLRDLGRRRLTVEALVVEQGLWRHGIGSALMDAAEAWARGNGADACFLNTYVHSAVSVPFYESKMGYERRNLGFWKRL
jgi:GNAT superfamily N-acetyltransferase